MSRVQIFIDGGNFYHLALKILKITGIDFDFNEFAEFLADSRETTNMGKRFYVGTVREQLDDPKSKKSMALQVKFLARLRVSGWETKTSKLRLREEKVIIDQRTKNYIDLLNKNIDCIEYQKTRSNQNI